MIKNILRLGAKVLVPTAAWENCRTTCRCKARFSATCGPLTSRLEAMLLASFWSHIQVTASIRGLHLPRSTVPPRLHRFSFESFRWDRERDKKKLNKIEPVLHLHLARPSAGKSSSRTGRVPQPELVTPRPSTRSPGPWSSSEALAQASA